MSAVRHLFSYHRQPAIAIVHIPQFLLANCGQDGVLTHFPRTISAIDPVVIPRNPHNHLELRDVILRFPSAQDGRLAIETAKLRSLPKTRKILGFPKMDSKPNPPQH